jgi:hypothetical protein
LNAVLAVAADYANVSNDGKLNIMGIFQELRPGTLPAQVPQMYLVITWDAGPAEFGSQKDCGVTFMGPDPNAGEFIKMEYQLVVPEITRPGARAIFHQIMGIGGLPINRPGPHAMHILVGGETKKEVPLYVHEPQEEVLPDG